MSTPRLDEVYDRAVAMERQAQKFYVALSKMFENRDDLRKFFAEMAAEEGGHARMLEDARKVPQSMTDIEAAELIHRIAKLEHEIGEATRLDFVHFDQVLLRARRIEKSELNKILAMLVHRALGDGAEPFVGGLDPHVAKLEMLEKKYPPEKRAGLVPER